MMNNTSTMASDTSTMPLVKYNFRGTVSETNIISWDEDFNRLNEEYEKLFPKEKRRFTFAELIKKYTKSKTEEISKVI